MAEKNQIKPAPYSKTDAAEVAAITTFESLLNGKNLKLDIRKRDKIPNIDGYIEIVDDLACPIGKLEVQIKKLPDDSAKMQCPLSLYAYSEITGNPVIFVGVDINQKRAYWQHINSKNLPQPLSTITQETITIHFQPENVIQGNDGKHIVYWKNIVESNLGRLKELEKYRYVIENSNTIAGATKEEFANIHYFLDYLNNFLDNEFSIVKDSFYPSAWKVGFAYHDYAPTSVSYTLFPIPTNKNDVQIKMVDEKLKEKLRNEGMGWTGYCKENPIRISPQKHAIDLVEGMMKDVLEAKLLRHKDITLAREFIFAFIDKFCEPMGLVKKDEYTIDEIEKSFYHLLLWSVEAINFLVKIKRNNIQSMSSLLYRRPYFDPDMLLFQIMPEERKQIEEAVQKRIAESYRVPIIPIGNNRFPFQIFIDSLSYLKQNRINSVKRLFVPKDFSKPKGNSCWVWELFSDEAIDKNLKVFFENLPSVYEEILSTNFPKLKLPLFGPANSIVVLYETEEVARKKKIWPIELFYLVSSEKEGLRIDVRKRDSATEYSELSFQTLQFDKEITINGKSCKFVGGSSSGLDFIYEDLPMFSYIYHTLKQNLKKYFDELRSSHK